MACDFRKAHSAPNGRISNSHGLSGGLTPGFPRWASNWHSCTSIHAVKVHEGRTITLCPVGDQPPAQIPEHISTRELGRFPVPESPKHSKGDPALNRVLLSTIMGAQTWQQLEALALTHSASFNHIHVSALVCRLPKVVHPAQLTKPEKSHFSRFLREISDLVTVRLSTFDPRAIANILWGVSKLGYSPAQPMLNKFLFEAYVRMHEFNAQELANLSWALATLASLGNRPVPVWLRKYTMAALTRVPELKPSELAHMAWALSKLFPPNAAGVTVAAATAKPLPIAAEVPWSRSSSGAHLPSTAQAADANSSSRSAPAGKDADGGQPSGTTSSVDAGGAASVPSVNPNKESSPLSNNSTAVEALQDLVTALASQSAVLLHEFRCGELVMTVTSLHTLDPSVGSRLIRPVLPHLLRSAPGTLSPQDLTNIWQLLGRCAWGGTDLGPELLQLPYGRDSSRTAPAGATAAAGAGLAAGNVRSVIAAGTVVVGVAENEEQQRFGGCTAAAASSRQGRTVARARREDQPLGRHHLHALMDATALALHDFTAQGLCLVLWSWARLRLQPKDEVVQAVFRRFSEVLPAQATFQCVSISLWAAAHLGLRPPPAVMGVFASCARLQAPASKPSELLALLWGMQCIRYQPSKDLLNAFNARIESLADQLSPDNLQVVLHAYALFGAAPPRTVRNRALGIATAVGLAVRVRAAGAAEPRLQQPTELELLVPKTEDVAVVSTAASAAASADTLDPLSGRPAMASPSSSSPAMTMAFSLLTRPPCIAVRYFATLAGISSLGLTPNNTRRQRVANMQLQMLRWRLEASSELRHELRAAIEGTVQGRLRELDGSALCALLATVVRLHMKPHAAFLQEVHEQVSQRVRTPGALTHWQAAWLLASLGRLHSRPTAVALTKLLSGLEPYLDGMSDSQLLSILEALARLRFRPSVPWLRGYLEECMARIDRWPAASLGLFLRSLGTLGLQLTGSPCRKLQVVVYRKKKRMVTGGGSGTSGSVGAATTDLPTSPRRRGPVRPVAAEQDLKRSLCLVCSELSGCSV